MSKISCVEDEKGAYAVSPLFYFNPQWPAERYDFDPGVSVIRAEPEVIDSMKKICLDPIMTLVGGLAYQVELALSFVKWLLVTSSFSEAENLPRPKTRSVSDIDTGAVWEMELDEIIGGFGDFSDGLREEFKSGFLSAMNVVVTTGTVAPLTFEAEIEFGDNTVEVTTIKGVYFIIHFEVFGEDLAEGGFPGLPKGEESDIEMIQEVWSTLARLRSLKEWADQICTAEFFSALDRRAGQRRQKYLDAGGNPDRAEAVYRSTFYKEFRKIRNEKWTQKTRLERALSLFEAGLNQERLYRFLSMCLVLETLYTMGEGEVKHKLATRLAHILEPNQDAQKREDYYKLASRVYKERSQVVHGEKSINSVQRGVQTAAVDLARKSLLRMLCNEDLLGLFGSQETEGSGRSKRLRQFFRALDLGFS